MNKPALRLIAMLLCLAAGTVQAQFSMVPAPLVDAAPAPSAADTEDDYVKDVARHIYAAYPMRIYRGKMPPLLFGVMMTETQLDDKGAVVDIVIARPPAAKEVAPWVVSLIKRASPFPAPAKLGGTLVKEVWLVDKSGLFQVRTLTEGQR